MALHTPAQIALRFRTDPKTLRIFLRADYRGRGLETPGKGARWAIEGKELSSLGARFRRWEAERAEAQAKAAAERAKLAQAAADEPETEAELDQEAAEQEQRDMAREDGDS